MSANNIHLPPGTVLKRLHTLVRAIVDLQNTPVFNRKGELSTASTTMVARTETLLAR